MNPQQLSDDESYTAAWQDEGGESAMLVIIDLRPDPEAEMGRAEEWNRKIRCLSECLSCPSMNTRTAYARIIELTLKYREEIEMSIRDPRHRSDRSENGNADIDRRVDQRVAAKLNISVHNVRVRRHRAMQILRCCMPRRFAGLPPPPCCFSQPLQRDGVTWCKLPRPGSASDGDQVGVNR